MEYCSGDLDADDDHGDIDDWRWHADGLCAVGA
jgi:hypothetical protein